jgi:hypothetical protein
LRLPASPAIEARVTRTATWLYGWLLLLPAAALLALFTHFPAVATLWHSFQSTPKGARPAVFVGIDNYRQLADDPIFWKAFANNLWFALGTIPVSIALAFRGLHYGRYGKNAEDSRIFPLFLGEETFIRGYGYGSITGNSNNECVSNGATTVMYEGAPNTPEPDRFWRIIDKYKVTILYTAPTAIRAFVRWGDDYPKRHDLSSLRGANSTGEPLEDSVRKEWQARFGCPIWEHYGISEAQMVIGDGPGIPKKEGSTGRTWVTIASTSSELPSDLLIFSPATPTRPLCIQDRANSSPAARDWASSFSWWGNTRSSPPPWMSKTGPRYLVAMAEHSRCHPGRPGPHGVSQVGSPGFAPFQRVKSRGSRLASAVSVRRTARHRAAVSG